MTSPADKIKEHLDQWQKLEIMKEKAPYSSIRDSYAEELEDFTRNNSANHRRAIEKLASITHCNCEDLGYYGAKGPCSGCRGLAEVAEMLSGGER